MANDSETEKNQKKINFIKFIKDHYVLSIISILFIGFILLSPLIFTKISTGIVFDSNVTKISNGISIMSPFIAIAAAIITFAAFWVQYKANVKVREDVDEDRKEKRKQQIISRFYEMLQIHRENVKGLEWNQKIQYEKDGNEDSFNQESECIQKRGRQIFFYYLLEFDFIYSVIYSLYPELDIKDRVKKAYNIFYKNAYDKKFSSDLREQMYSYIRKGKYKNGVSQKDCPGKLVELYALNDWVKKKLNDLFIFKDYFQLQPPFKKGHFDELNNYYRHLYFMVKAVANEEEKYLSYDEKRDLLRILRAQLTNTEQIMLFYNWFSGNGSQWEQDDPNGNHFFTRYRMIHNIMPSRIIPTLFYNGVRDEYQSFIDYLKEKELPIYSSIKTFCSEKDKMFQFEDWEGFPKFDYDK